jgi:hypothetical protein
VARSTTPAAGTRRLWEQGNRITRSYGNISHHYDLEDPQRAIFLVKNEPVPAFRHKTLLQLVQEGRTEDVIGYLESISAGFVG